MLVLVWPLPKILQLMQIANYTTSFETILKRQNLFYNRKEIIFWRKLHIFFNTFINYNDI